MAKVCRKMHVQKHLSTLLSFAVHPNVLSSQGPPSQRLQYPLVKEHTLKYSRDPYYNLRYILFLNEGILESLGSLPVALLRGALAISPRGFLPGCSLPRCPRTLRLRLLWKLWGSVFREVFSLLP